MCGRALFRLLYWMDVLSRANVIRRPTVIKTIPPLFGFVLCVCVHGANKRKKEKKRETLSITTDQQTRTVRNTNQEKGQEAVGIVIQL